MGQLCKYCFFTHRKDKSVPIFDQIDIERGGEVSDHTPAHESVDATGFEGNVSPTDLRVRRGPQPEINVAPPDPKALAPDRFGGRVAGGGSGSDFDPIFGDDFGYQRRDGLIKRGGRFSDAGLASLVEPGRVI